MRLIEADALLTVPNVQKVTEYDETGEGITYLAVPVEAIEKAPTIETEPVRHGKWLMITDSKHCGVCSVCLRQDFIDPIATHCRYCGAKMDLEEGNR